MKKFSVFSFLLTVLLFSCKSKDTESVIRVDNQDYRVVTDSIYTRLPGKILYHNNLVYWQDAVSAEQFMHVVDIVTGSELDRFANIGEGPEEFTLPLFSILENVLYISDTNKPLESSFQFDENMKKITWTSYKYVNNVDATRLVHLSNDTRLYLEPSNDTLFRVNDKGVSDSFFGYRPFNEKINNAYDVFQGNVEYHSKHDLLVYASIFFPYIAVYKTNGNKVWELVNEIKGKYDYTVADGKLKFSSDTPIGAWEIALTKDYIVVLQRDESIEEAAPRERIGRDPSTRPRSLFVYDYSLNLQKIINMPFSMLRLCGDMESNEVYAIGCKPDYELINIKL